MTNIALIILLLFCSANFVFTVVAYKRLVEIDGRQLAMLTVLKNMWEKTVRNLNDRTEMLEHSQDIINNLLKALAADKDIITKNFEAVNQLIEEFEKTLQQVDSRYDQIYEQYDRICRLLNDIIIYDEEEEETDRIYDEEEEETEIPPVIFEGGETGG